MTSAVRGCDFCEGPAEKGKICNVCGCYVCRRCIFEAGRHVGMCIDCRDVVRAANNFWWKTQFEAHGTFAVSGALTREAL